MLKTSANAILSAELRHGSSVRVTATIGTLSGGGAERNLLRLCDALALRGHRVTVLTVNPGAEDFYEVPSTVERRRAHPAAFMDCRWYNLPCQRIRRAALRRALLETEPDVVISFIDTMNVGALVTLWRDKVPVLVAERSDPRYQVLNRRWSILRRLFYPLAARVIVQTESVAAWARRKWPKWRVEVVPNPVVESVVPRAASKVGHGRRTVTSMGRLVSLKQFDQLIQAFALISRDFPEWDLMIIGEGPERSRLEALAIDLGVSERVRMPGAIKSPEKVLVASDLFVFSSRYEGFPNALCEAMAAGLPAVSYDCPSGPGEIIRHEVDGLLVPPQDVGALSQAMRRMMGSPVERQRMAERAIEITRRFSSERIFDRWEQLIRDVLAEAV
jgi:glycosyltransferase involved in cell wall biosynthesis